MTETATETVTETMTETATETVTETVTQTTTPTVTKTVTQTNTQTITPTATPARKIQKCFKAVYIQFKRVPATHHYKLYVNDSNSFIIIRNTESEPTISTRFTYRLCWEHRFTKFRLFSVGPNGVLPVEYTLTNKE
jgi:hypothetical protein